MPTDIIMVMEYARGELFNLIVEKGKMCEDDARRFFQQIICAVEYCHRHKIVHRDLKPENLLLDPYNNVKIADFGLSNIMTDGDFLKTSCGSPNYAAPEVISGRLYAGPEVDVWSCGVILFVMLCGRLPFDDEYIPTLFKKINGGIYTLPSFISAEAKYLLNSMLIVDPLKRITIQEIRQTSWFNVGLPDYLKPLPDSEEVFFDEIDDSIVSEIHKKMGFSKDTIYQALQEIENNQIKVAYQLVVDNKRMITAGRISGQKNMQSFLAASPSWDTLQYSRRKVNVDEDDDEPSSIVLDGNVEDNETSSIALLSSSLPPVEEFLKVIIFQ
ncbi:Pkinase-domain-containing protein [Gigaspora margarita]|nr:Pkinase-domain-containing protein [Gigaspora margarita]